MSTSPVTFTLSTPGNVFILDENPGACPDIPTHEDSICSSYSCSNDSDCATLGQKCCFVAGCSSRRCVNPVALTQCVVNGTIHNVGESKSVHVRLKICVWLRTLTCSVGRNNSFKLENELNH